MRARTPSRTMRLSSAKKTVMERPGTLPFGPAGGARVKEGPTRVGVASPPPSARREPPLVGPGFVRFVQTAGGRSGIPAPRSVRRKPFVQLRAPTVWTTLALTIHADGSSEHEVVGASRFPRHWVYDGAGKLVAKVG